jgi:PhzF family phenazine biosynthesis protein
MDFYSVRAFCSDRFFGNPAAVGIVEKFPENAQQMAASINFSETVFVKPYKKNMFLIRWFSPKDEAPLCGHATIAATYMLNKKYGLSQFTLIHRQGIIQSLVDAQDKVHMTMDQRSITPLAITSKYENILPFGIKSAYTDDIVDIFVLETEQNVLNYQPHLENIMKINKRAIVLTAQAKDYDYITRYFAPSVGINEDPFCGSINCRLAPYWSSILGKKRLNSYQLKGCSEFVVHDKHVEFIAEATLYAERKLMIA